MVKQNTKDLLELKDQLSKRFLQSREPINVVSAAGKRSMSRGTRATRDLTSSINGVSVGLKVVSGIATANASVRVYVERKLPLSDLAKAEQIASNFDGIPVDIVESPRAYFSQDFLEFILNRYRPMRKKKVRPLKAGISVSRRGGGTGTISSFCRDAGQNSGRRLMLLNAHVAGCFTGGTTGDEFFQPGHADGGCEAGSEVATLVRHVPIATGPGVQNRVDAGLAELDPGVDYRCEIHKLGSLRGKTSAAEGLVVIKHGRTTGLTRGIITDVDLDYLVYPNRDSDQGALFVNQIRIKKIGRKPFSGPGDSGSLILERYSRKAVGLLFATAETFSMANHVHDVEAALGIEIQTEI